MKKTYKIEVDCANCANLMEDAAGKTEGVAAATVNFMTQKLTLEAADETFDQIIEVAQKAICKVDPNCLIIR